ncbi:oxygenase MpaB family protein [Amycolatopsis sp.]|jgi:uncharacterized protein (DUF2236 family)|uniref:oxygenase MpaB family protein n=1 Tax=Amycolatopsis sp. TaxID=37632 RepID=UPI002E04894A|nr:oxygenase MpaB family protein [Amycolatopsis sp.]
MTVPPDPALDLEDVVIGLGLIAGPANVVMQLARPGVGHGVVESKVDSGNVFLHPVKRARTTLTYLAVATLGTPEEKEHFRRGVNRAHAQVHSDASSPVEYNAFDTDLQLWVAACLYKGVEDIYTALGRGLTEAETEFLYRESAVLGTTLQVKSEMWPSDRAAFEKYWNASLDKVSMDDVVRGYLHRLITLKFMPQVVSVPFGPLNKFVTTGFLPQRFRDEMRLPWTGKHQRRFDRLMALNAAFVRALPPMLRKFPYNLALWDLRRRVKNGKPLV